MAEAIDRGPRHAGGPAGVKGWPRADAEPAAASHSAERSVGLSLLALAAAAIAVSMLNWAAAWFGASDIAPGSPLAALASVVGAALVTVAVLEVVFAYGTRELRSWAWPLGVALAVAALALTELSAGRGPEGAHMLSLLVEIGTLWYLLSPGVHDAFRAGRR
jgi:hypothetical protein